MSTFGGQSPIESLLYEAMKFSASLMKPQRMRVEGRFPFPSVTIDFTSTNESPFLRYFQPKVTVLVAGNAVQYDSKTGTFKQVDPSIFDKPTWFDRYGRFLPIAGLVLGIIVVNKMRGK
jgi:hypothetical protein